MARGGYRPGAGRRVGSTKTPKDETEKVVRIKKEPKPKPEPKPKKLSEDKVMNVLEGVVVDPDMSPLDFVLSIV